MIEIRPDLNSPETLHALVAEANLSPFIGELQVNELIEMQHANAIRFMYVDGELVGFGGWVLIGDDWCEDGPFFVSGRFRGQGLGRQIIHAIIEQPDLSQRHQYAITRNPAVKAILRSEGFQQVSFLKLPSIVQLFLVRKINLRKISQFLRKRHPEPAAHFVRMQDASR